MGKKKRRKTVASKTLQPAAKGGRKLAQNQKREQQPTIPFNAEERILLIGEGDFSFARSVVEHHGCADVTATCLDTKAELYEKYEPQAEENVTYLETEGQTVLCAVDATKLRHKDLHKGQRFECIIFNFPHVGGKSTDVNRQVRANQELLVDFFGAAAPLLAPDGTIAVTLFESEPYTLWNVRDLARHSGLEVLKSFIFQAAWYPGYSHARTLGNIDGGGGWKGEDRDARSYVFRVKGGDKGATTGSPPHKKRKRADDDELSEDE